MTPAEAYTYFKDDYLSEDCVETLTLTPPSGISGAAVPTAKGKFGELSRRELMMIGQELMAAKYDAVLFLYDTTLGGLKPESRFMVTQADGSKWMIASAVHCKHGTQWVCTVTRGK